MLRHQGLLPPYLLSGKEGIIDFIGKVGCIQFDPLNIVGHNPELVLQSRIAGFRPEMLQELLYKDRRLLDEWDKMMAIYRTEDFPFFVYRQREAAQRSTRRNTEAISEVIPQVRRAIEERGPLSSIDLDHDRKVDWAWGPTRLAKVALENMYYTGELIIHHKLHTRRYYDLASRHIPEEIINAPDPHQRQEEYHDWHVLRRIGGMGLAWVSHALHAGIYGAGSPECLAAIKRLVKKGEVKEVTVDGINKPLFIRNDDMASMEEAADSNDGINRAAIIAPLDNLLWARGLIAQLFDFKYRWEVYKPVAEREYGYYVLPVLYGDRFIARFEPGRQKNGALEIKNWWWEADIEKTGDIKDSLSDCFERFLKYLGTEKIEVHKTLVKKEDLSWLPCTQSI